ncbi:MAG: ferritin-like domain-containing protein [Ferruginibacter sp.]
MNKRIYKIAQAFEISNEKEQKKQSGSKAGEKMAIFAASLRAVAVLHQNAHWICDKTTFYGDHLLFQRIYEKTDSHVDTVAEKTVGIFGAEFIKPSFFGKIIAETLEQADSTNLDSLLATSLAAEQALLKQAKELYDELKESGDMTLGIDDLIMSIASDHEENVYLLKQRTSK